MPSRTEAGDAAPDHDPGGRSNDPAPRFSAVLRERTRDVHREAERSGFIADLIRGRATRDGYALFLRNLVPVYEAMETALGAAMEAGLRAASLAAASDPRAGLLRAFADPGLRRGPALRADLAALAGPGWASRLAVLPEAADYAAGVAAAGSGPGLVAHAYARYLGDLSGGQILKPILGRSLGLDAATLAFYDFPAFPGIDEPKAAMRDALDLVEPASPFAEAVAAEAVAAFRHNIALATAVSRHFARSPAQPSAPAPALPVAG